MATETEWQPVVKDLYKLIQDNDWSQNFSQAIHDAKRADVPDLDGIDSLDDYLNSINDFLFWMPTENQRGDVVYNKICLFYWILNQPTLSLLQTQILPKEAGKDLTPLSQWIVKYANTLGTYYDTEASIDAATVATFYASPAYKMDQYVEPEGGWKTFNEFFARHVKPGLRLPDDKTNPEVIVSAADSVFDGHWPINGDNDVIFVKGVPWNIEQLLEGSQLAGEFRGGTFMHAFLNTTDYHRQHAPIMGRVVEAQVIAGSAYLEVVPTTTNQDSAAGGDSGSTPQGSAPRLRNRFAMRRRLSQGKTDANIIRRVYRGIEDDYRTGPEHSPNRSKEVKGVSAPDNPGYQFLQARGCVVIDSPVGLVAVLPIGMAQVSSVRLSVKEGDVVEKGQEISYFQFGGSDIVLVFQRDSKVALTAVVGEHYNTGKQIGTAEVPHVA